MTVDSFSCFDKFPKKTSARMLFDTVMGKDHHPVLFDGDLISSVNAKIRVFVQEIRDTFRSAAGAKYATLAYAKLEDFQAGTFQLVKKLTRMIWIKPDSVEAKRAHYALHLMEGMDPTIALVSKQAAKFIAAKGNSRARRKLSRYLARFAQKEKPLMLKHPVRPARVSCPVIIPRGKIHPFWKIQAICVGSRDETTTDFFANLQDVAQRERFSLPEAEILNLALTWLCDPMVLKAGKPLVPQSLDARTGFFIGVCRDLYALPEKTDLMGAVSELRASEQLALHFPDLVEQAPFYFEGGNLLEAINKKGQKIYLSGSANTLFSALNIAQTFSREEIAEIIEEARDLPQEASDMIEILEERLFDSSFFEEWSIRDTNLLARILIASAPKVRQKMEGTLGHPVCQIGKTFEAQPEFHIDMFLVPAPGGKIFMQNYGKVILLLDKLLQNKDLSSIDRGRLLEYREQAIWRRDLDQDQLDGIAEDLKAVGFDVVAVAGLFHDQDGAIAANYLNAIFGQNRSGIYCITNGSLHSVDEHLQKAYVASLRPHKVRNVYFTGRKSTGPVSSFGGLPFAAAHDSLALSGGVHCRVQVMRDTHDYSKVYEMFRQMPEVFRVADLPRQLPPYLAFKDIVDEANPKPLRPFFNIERIVYSFDKNKDEPFVKLVGFSQFIGQPQDNHQKGQQLIGVSEQREEEEVELVGTSQFIELPQDERYKMQQLIGVSEQSEEEEVELVGTSQFLYPVSSLGKAPELA